MIRFLNMKYFIKLSFTFLFCISVGFLEAQEIIQAPNHLQRIIEHGVITTEGKALVYKLDRNKGELEYTIRDENLETVASNQVQLNPNILNFTFDSDSESAYLLFSWGRDAGYGKALVKVGFNSSVIEQHAISSNMVFPLVIKPIQDGLVMMGSIEEGDFLEIYNYKTGELHSITDFFNKDSRIWDMRVLRDQVDVLLYTSGKKRVQQLQILSYDKDAQRTLRLPIKLPDDKKFYIQMAQLLFGPYEEYKVVGTYSFKPGEWFTGYFQLEINEFLEQDLHTYAFKDFEGFYDFKGESKRRKKGLKNFSREMRLIEAVTDGEFITVAAQPIKTNRKFVHFLTIDAEGNKVFDKSIKLYYNLLVSSGGGYQMANQRSKVYFLFRGNQNRLNIPGDKVFLLENGELVSVNQVKNILKDNENINQLDNPKYKHWYGNKFLIYGVVRPTVQEPFFVVQKIEV